jgi:hypothetical protein
MTSTKKIAANRNNARKSTGPRTAQGKSRTSRNALRHGFAIVPRPNGPASAQIESMAKAICGEGATPFQYEQALTIAESEMMLLRVRAARVAAIERARTINPMPNVQASAYPTNDEWALALEALARGQPRPATRLFERAARAVLAEAATAANVTANQLDPTGEERPLPVPQRGVTAAQAAAQSATQGQFPSAMCNEVDAFKNALPELIRLDRYEQRALSRRQRAIRMFDASSILAHSDGRNHAPGAAKKSGD